MLAQLHTQVHARWDYLVEILGQGAHAAFRWEVFGHGDVEKLLQDSDQFERDVASFSLLASSKSNKGTARLRVELCTKLHGCHLVERTYTTTHEAEHNMRILGDELESIDENVIMSSSIKKNICVLPMNCSSGDGQASQTRF